MKVLLNVVNAVDRVSRPRQRPDNPVERRKRRRAVDYIGRMLSIALSGTAAGGILLVLALLLLTPERWNDLDKTLREFYWRPFFTTVEQFEEALQSADESRIKADADRFFQLARDVRRRDYGEARYVRALEMALAQSAPPAVRLRAAEVGTLHNPNDSLFWYRLGVEHLKLGQLEAGTTALKRAFQLRSYSHQIAAALVNALEQSGDTGGVARVREQYASGVVLVAGKRAALHLLFITADGTMKGVLMRFDACRPLQLDLAEAPGRLRSVVFPSIDGLHVSVSNHATVKLDHVANFKAEPDGGFISQIAANDPFSAAPVLTYDEFPDAATIEICARGARPI